VLTFPCDTYIDLAGVEECAVEQPVGIPVVGSSNLFSGCSLVVFWHSHR
jgi:hypothetical protein